MAYAEFPRVNMYDSDLKELLDMYEKLTKDYATLVQQIGDCYTLLRNYQSSIPIYVSKLVDTAIKAYRLELERNVAMLQTEMLNLENRIERKFDNVNSDTSLLFLKFEELKERQVEYETEFNEKLSEMRLLILGNNAKNEKMIADAVKSMNEKIDAIPDNSVPVYNPFTQEQDTTKNVLLDMYNLGITYHGFTALEFTNSTVVTCGYFNDSEITCIDWWTHGKEILIKNGYLFSPVTGKFVTIETALYDLAKEIKAGKYITAQGYDNKNITAEAYEDTNISAENYDFNGKEILKNV